MRIRGEIVIEKPKHQGPLDLALRVSAVTVLGLVAAHLTIELIRPTPPSATRAERHAEALSERVTVIGERVTVQNKRVTSWGTQVQLLIDAVNGGALRERTDQNRCAIHYLADTVGRRKQLSLGGWGLKGAPAAANWSAWPPGWDQCEICDDGYACNVAQRGSQ